MNEHALQSAYFDWIRLLAKTDDRYQWAFAIPNGFWIAHTDKKRGGAFVNKMKREGLTPGVSDVCIPYPTKRYHGLYIEFKMPKKQPSALQKRFLMAMRDRGYCAGCITNIDDAMNLTLTYMKGDVR